MIRLGLFCILVVSAGAEADAIYKYTQKDGTIVYTNVAPAGIRSHVLKGSFSPSPRLTGPAAAKPVSNTLYDAWIDTAARTYNVPQELVRAVMQVESNFKHNAVSSKGAAGLMQLMPQTAREMYVKDMFDARENIEGGARYLRVLANLFKGDMVKMVAAYNAGPEAVNKFNGQVPPYPETQDYVRRVVHLYFKYKSRSQLAQTEQR